MQEHVSICSRSLMSQCYFELCAQIASRFIASETEHEDHEDYAVPLALWAV